MNIKFECNCRLAVVDAAGEGENHGSQIPPTHGATALTRRLVHKGLHGANCRALDDISAIFERHNAHCRIMNGTTHFKKLISFPFVLPSDDTNPSTMAECSEWNRKSDRLVWRQLFFRSREGPGGHFPCVDTAKMGTPPPPPDDVGTPTCVEKLARVKERLFFFPHPSYAQQRLGGRFVFGS